MSIILRSKADRPRHRHAQGNAVPADMRGAILQSYEKFVSNHNFCVKIDPQNFAGGGNSGGGEIKWGV